MKTSKTEKNKHPPCPACGGTGQLSSFKGESRFLLTDEECPFCSGLGYLPGEENETAGTNGSAED